MTEQISPSLIYQLKRALGDDHMSLEEAIRQSIHQATDARGLKVALHSAIVSPEEEVPASAERFVDAQELKFARVRRMGMAEPTEVSADDVCTVEDVANELGIASRLVARWFDAGRLDGYVVGPLRERRIRRESLQRFLESQPQYGSSCS